MAQIDMVTTIIGVIMAIIIAICAYKKIVSGNDDSYSDRFPLYMMWFMVTVIGTGVTFLMLAVIVDPIKHYYFPEYYAIQDMLRIFGR